MPIKGKLFIVLFFGVLSSFIVTAWNQFHLTQSQREGFALESVRQQVHLAAELFDLQIADLRADLFRRVSQHPQNPNGIELKTVPGNSLDPFNLIGVMTLNDQGRWKLDWLEVSKRLESVKRPEFDNSIQSFVMDSLKPGQLSVQWIQGHRNYPSQLALLLPIRLENISAEQLPEQVNAMAPPIRNRPIIALGWLSDEYLNRVVRYQKGSVFTATLLDPDGIRLAYPNSAYVGSQEKNQHLLSKIKSDLAPFGELKFDDHLKQNGVLAYRRLSQSTATVVVSAPVTLKQLGATSYFAKVGFSIAGILILGFMLVSLLEKMGLKREARLRAKHDLDLWQDRESQLKQEYSQQITVEKAVALKNLVGGLTNHMYGPITSVLAQGQKVRSLVDPRRIKECYTVIEREARKLKNIIEGLIQFNGDDNVRMSKVDLRQITLDLLQSLDEQLKAAGITVVKELTAVPEVLGNPHQLQSCLQQLILNAIHAMSHSPTKQITISLYAPETSFNKLITLVIEDTGKGMSDETKTKIFEPFFKEDPGDSGLGMGLSVVLGVIKNHSGEISVDSKSGSFARFVIQLPAATKDSLRDLHQQMESRQHDHSHTARPPDLDQSLQLSIIGGKAPIRGPLADKLPEVPAADEIGLVGLMADTDSRPIINDSRYQSDTRGLSNFQVRKPKAR